MKNKVTELIEKADKAILECMEEGENGYLFGKAYEEYAEIRREFLEPKQEPDQLKMF